MRRRTPTRGLPATQQHRACGGALNLLKRALLCCCTGEYMDMEGFEGLVDHTDEETGATREETPWTSTDDTLARLDERARRGDEARARAREIRRGRLRGEDAKEEEEEEAADDDDADE